MIIDINDESADLIVKEVVKGYIKYIKEDIKRIKKLKKQTTLKEFQIDDLRENKRYLEALETVYEYVGGNLIGDIV